MYAAGAMVETVIGTLPPSAKDFRTLSFHVLVSRQTVLQLGPC
jgi:hypothetical protein